LSPPEEPGTASPDEGSRRAPRPPEPLALPTDPGQRPGTPPASTVPFFALLEQQTQQHQAALENQRRADRVEHIKRIQNIRDSKVVIYYSLDTLVHDHGVLLYELLRTVGQQERLDLLLRSPGGYADAAFKMAGYCRDFAEEQFSVLIPHDAKSAATLLCLGADELVMGDPSELGPVDPRIAVRDNYGRNVQVSATSVKDALELLENLVGDSAEKSLKYMPLIERLNLDVLGEYKRALESSKQQAEELLLRGGLLSKISDEADRKKEAKKLAKNLAEGYYSHGYPIGPNTARDKLKMNVTYARGTPELDELWNTIWHLHNLCDATVRAGDEPVVLFETEETVFTSRQAMQ
jgi:ClpP class serine protease